MKKHRIITVIALLALMVTSAAGCSNSGKSKAANSTGWVPTKPIELVVTSSAGGGSDLFARTMVKIISDNNFCPQPINVVNKSGGGGSIGYSYLNGKAKDPYFLGITSSSYYTTPLMGGSPVSLKNFTHLVHMAKDPQVMVVNSQAPYKTLEELIKFGKSNPKALKAGVSNNASDDAIAAYILGDKSGIDMSIVPFTSGGEVLTNILGNHIDVAFSGPGESLEQIKAGKLIAIATSNETRLDILPDVPTFKEKGIDLTIQQSRGVIMTSGVSAEQIAFYEDMFKKVSETEAWKNYVKTNAMVSVYMGSNDYTKFSNDLNTVYAEYTKGLKK